MKEKEFDLFIKLQKGETVTVVEGEYGISDMGPTEEQFLAFCRGVLDNGGARNVVVKFMKTKEQFDKERKIRQDLQKDISTELALYVCPIIQSFDITSGTDSNTFFKETMTKDLMVEPSFELTNYNKRTKEIAKKGSVPYSELYVSAVVMLGGDMDFQTILEKENTTMNTRRMYLEMIGRCLDYLHRNNIVHLDLRPSNVVRIRDRMYLIDLDASTNPSSETAGAKNRTYYGALSESIPTGIFPPEMIVKMNGAQNLTYEDYFMFTPEVKEGQDAQDPYYKESWIEKKVKPKRDGNAGYGVRLYRIEGNSIASDKKLAYKDKLVPNAKSLDIWAYGLMVYLAVTNSHLVPVSNTYDLASFDSYKKLHGWTDAGCVAMLGDAIPFEEEEAQDLLSALLKRAPAQRGKSNDPKWLGNLLQNMPFYQPKVYESRDGDLEGEGGEQDLKKKKNYDLGATSAGGTVSMLFTAPLGDESEEEKEVRIKDISKMLDKIEKKKAEKDKFLDEVLAEGAYPLHTAMTAEIPDEYVARLIDLVGPTKNVGTDDHIYPLHIAIDSQLGDEVITRLVTEEAAKQQEEKEWPLCIAIRKRLGLKSIQAIYNANPEALIATNDGHAFEENPLHQLVATRYTRTQEHEVGQQVCAFLLKKEKELVIERKKSNEYEADFFTPKIPVPTTENALAAYDKEVAGIKEYTWLLKRRDDKRNETPLETGARTLIDPRIMEVRASEERKTGEALRIPRR